MISKKEIEKMNIAFDFSRQYTIARVPKVYRNAEQFALEVVYSLRPYISDKLGIDHGKIILIAVSKNNKVVPQKNTKSSGQKNAKNGKNRNKRK